MLWISRIPREVRKEWSEILKGKGLDEDRAKIIIARICGDARLMLGKPDEETVEVVKERLGKVNLGVEDEEEVKKEMIRALESWIEQKTGATPTKALAAEAPVLYSPAIEAPKVLEEKDPEDIIISDILEQAWEKIQEDFEKHELEVVLRRFAKSVVGVYENLLKFVIFGNYDEHSREVLYKALIKNRVSEVLRALRKR